MKWPEIEAILIRAKEQFLNKDRDLLEVDATERSMTHKFAEYLQLEFPDWNVDCEYNRHGEVPKQLQWAVGEHVSPADEHGTTVFPDIIVHHRRRTKTFW